MSLASLTRFLYGYEVTRGTAVAPTSRLYMTGDLPTEGREQEYVTQERADFNEYHDAYQTHIKVEWTGEQIFNYADAQFWMGLALQGDITPSEVTGTYTRDVDSQSTTDDLESITLYGTDNVASVRVPFAMCQSWEIAGDDGKGPKGITLKMDFLGQQAAAVAAPAALADTDIRGTYAHFTQARLFVDDTSAGLGTTEFANALMAFSIKGDNKLSPNYTGGGNMLYTSMDRGERHVEVMVDLLLDAAMYAEWSSNFQGNELRYARLQFDGPGVHEFSFDFSTRWESAEFKRGDGTRRVVLLGKSLYCPTWGNSWTAQLVNEVA